MAWEPRMVPSHRPESIIKKTADTEVPSIKWRKPFLAKARMVFDIGGRGGHSGIGTLTEHVSLLPRFPPTETPMGDREQDVLSLRPQG